MSSKRPWAIDREDENYIYIEITRMSSVHGCLQMKCEELPHKWKRINRGRLYIIDKTKITDEQLVELRQYINSCRNYMHSIFNNNNGNNPKGIRRNIVVPPTDRLMVNFPQGTKDRIKATGIPLNEFIVKAVLNELDKHKKKL